jgi:rSAM/selenodomain-associated transferase 1
MDRVLGVFAKKPLAGAVKTRLGLALGAEVAARLYEAFLRDFLPRLSCLPVRLVLAYTPPNGRDFFESLVGDRFKLEEQAGSDIGVRMANFFERQFECGATQVALVGSDSPNLPISRIEQAFVELDHRDIVFGPCDDGGYYLIGMSRMIPEVFEGIHWSEPGVFRQTVRRVAQLPLRLALLERWYDIDRLEDVSFLSAEIGAAHRAGRDLGLAHTEAVLRDLPISL